MWSYYLLLRHFRPWPAVMEKLCDELKAWSDCLSVPVAWLSMNWVCHGLFSSPLDGSRSIWCFLFFFPSSLCVTEWWYVKEWSITAKLYEHHATGICIQFDFIFHVTERVNRQANCGTNYRRALISNFTGIFRCHFNIDWKRMRDRMGYCSRHQSHHVLIVCKIIFNMNLYCWFFAQKKKKKSEWNQKKRNQWFFDIISSWEAWIAQKKWKGGEKQH